MPSTRALVGAATVGAVGEYLLDPQNGKRRRHVARDKAVAWIRRPARKAAAEAERRASYVAGKAQGVAHRATVGGDERDPSRLNDPALKAKVESIAFRPAEIPKGSIDVNVENRVVFLRGEVADEETIARLVREVEAIDGVAEVRSLLHEPEATASRKL
jgi:osmotically-inducible protein OsmY